MYCMSLRVCRRRYFEWVTVTTHELNLPYEPDCRAGEQTVTNVINDVKSYFMLVLKLIYPSIAFYQYGAYRIISVLICNFSVP